MPVTLFGDEPEEKQLHQTRGPQAQACHEHDDDDDEGQVQQATAESRLVCYETVLQHYFLGENEKWK